MQIVIPMSGIGKRFIDAGYPDPKPLIEVDGKPIIEHVVNMFPGEENFTFICNGDHLRTTRMREILQRIAPKGRIVEIPPHKLGPVYAVTAVMDAIADDEEVIVNYCDFSCYWDYQGFLRHTRERNADGAVPAYRGFHPHMLGTTNYAFMRDEDQWMLAIKEKAPFTDNRMQEYASSGTYYFKRAADVKKYFRQAIDTDLSLNGEFYVSLVYNLLKADGLSVSIYEIEHMLQWGTPQDLQEYEAWSAYFASLAQAPLPIPVEFGSTNLVPLAGAGSRFAKEGYQDPKPLIDVSGKPMIVQAVNSLPPAEKHAFVCLGSHLDAYPLAEAIDREYPGAAVTRVDQVTQGQACTCELAMPGIDPEAPLLIAACDNGMLWDRAAYQRLRDEDGVDAIIWSFRHHPSSARNPEMYGWLDVDAEGFVRSCSVKKPISADPYNDHAIVGTFYFKQARHFKAALESLYRKDVRVNGEFYVDSCVNELIESGLKVKVFEIDHYACWGTPNDLRTFQYWQRFFHKWPYHPYSLDLDPTVAPDRLAELRTEMERWAHEHNRSNEEAAV